MACHALTAIADCQAQQGAQYCALWSSSAELENQPAKDWSINNCKKYIAEKSWYSENSVLSAGAQGDVNKVGLCKFQII